MNNEKNLKNIGNNIKAARLKENLTQATLAEKCNVSSKYISALETGSTSGSIPLIINICNILNVTPNYIFENTIKINNLDEYINIIDNDILIKYEKLKDENKAFVDQTINHLYNMQKKR